MGIFHDELHRVMRELRNDESLMSDVLQCIFKNRGLPVSEEHLTTIVQSLLAGATSFDLPSEGPDQTMSITDEDIDLAMREFEFSHDGKIERAIKRVVEELSPRILGSLYKDLPNAIQGWHEEQQAFKDQLYEQWKEGLDRLDMLIAIAHESSEAYIADFQHDSEDAEPLEGDLFRVLTALHCRACRTASEIVCLLKAGFADGAHARWRSLHELAVTAQFLAEHRIDTPQRYIDHGVVEEFRAAKQYQQHCETLGYDPFSEDEMNEMKKASDDAIARYGQAFKEDYGWAANALNIPRPNFAQIEASLDMSHWRPWFRLACQNVHAGSKGMRSALGIPYDAPDVLLAGASNFGLTAPGQQMAISLTIASIAFFTSHPNLDGLIACEFMLTICEDIEMELRQVDEAMDD